MNALASKNLHQNLHTDENDASGGKAARETRDPSMRNPQHPGKPTAFEAPEQRGRKHRSPRTKTPGAGCLLVRNPTFASAFPHFLELSPAQHSADRGDPPSSDLSHWRILVFAHFPSRETLCGGSTHPPLLPFTAMQPAAILFGGVGGGWGGGEARVRGAAYLEEGARFSGADAAAGRDGEFAGRV